MCVSKTNEDISIFCKKIEKKRIEKNLIYKKISKIFRRTFEYTKSEFKKKYVTKVKWMILQILDIVNDRHLELVPDINNILLDFDFSKPI